VPTLRILAALAALAAAAALAADTSASAPGRAALPLVRVTLGHRGPVIHGPVRWRPGAVRIDVSTSIPDQELTLLRFHPGYGYGRFLADGAAANGHAAGAAAAMRRVLANTDFLGGADVFPGTPATFTVTVAPGTYYLGEMTGRPAFEKIVVVGAARPVAPAAGAVLTAYDFGFRVDGPALPAHGTITIRNTGRQLHRLNLVPVRAGTTRAEVGAYLRRTGGRPDGPPPPFARRGPQLGTSMISPGGRFELGYRLPAGDYAIVCFQPDGRTGRPQALEGMYAVVTLR
jgi:hypothetical protein